MTGWPTFAGGYCCFFAVPFLAATWARQDSMTFESLVIGWLMWLLMVTGSYLWRGIWK